MAHASLEVCGFGIGTHHVGAIHPDFFWKANLVAGSSWGTENTRPRGRRDFIFLSFSPCPCYIFSCRLCLGRKLNLSLELFLGQQRLVKSPMPMSFNRNQFSFFQAVFGAKHEPLATAMLGEEPEPRVLVEPAEAG